MDDLSVDLLKAYQDSINLDYISHLRLQQIEYSAFRTFVYVNAVVTPSIANDDKWATSIVGLWL